LSNLTQKIKETKAMTELVLKVDDIIAEKFKEVSLQRFEGDEALTFEIALKSLLSNDDLDLVRFEQIVGQIQDDIKAAGGMTDKEIDACIATYRKEKRARGKELEGRH
jgi:hypothetical protein